LYTEGVFRALKDAGKRVTLDLHRAQERPALAKEALKMGIPLRVSAAAPCNSGTADNFCQPAPGYEFYVEEHEEADSMDARAIRSRLLTLSAGGAAGFEIDVPSSHLGGEPDNWRFRDHTAFYMNWGRLGYDPKYQFPSGAK